MPDVKKAARKVGGTLAGGAKAAGGAIKSGAKAVGRGAKKVGSAAKEEATNIAYDVLIAKAKSEQEKLDRHMTIFSGHVRTSHKIVAEAHAASLKAAKAGDWKTALKHMDRIAQAIEVIPTNVTKAAVLMREYDKLELKIHDYERQQTRDGDGDNITL